MVKLKNSINMMEKILEKVNLTKAFHIGVQNLMKRDMLQQMEVD